MAKLTDVLRSVGSEVRISTLKALFIATFASDRDASHDLKFWSDEQWRKGIEGLATSGSAATLEHWFTVDRFNSLINILDKRFLSIINRIEALIEYAKTIDSTLPYRLGFDNFNNTNLLAQCYNAIYSKSLLCDFSNLKNVSTDSVKHFLSISRIPSVRLVNTKLTIATSQPLGLSIRKAIEWSAIDSDTNVIASGSVNNPNIKSFSVSNDISEFDIYFPTDTINIPSTKYQTFLFTIKIPINTWPNISKGVFRVSALTKMTDTISYFPEKILIISNVNAGSTHITLDLTHNVFASLSHQHAVKSKSGAMVDNVSLAPDGYYGAEDNDRTYDPSRHLHPASTSGRIRPLIELNSDMLNAKGIRVRDLDHTTDAVQMRGAETKLIDWQSYSDVYSQSNPIQIYGMSIKGFVWT